MSPTPTDLLLELATQGVALRVRLARPDTASVVADVPGPPPAGWRDALAAHAEQPLPPGFLERVGEELGALLLPPTLHAALARCLPSAGEPAIRLRLRVPEPELAALPWELARTDLPGGSAGGWLALHPRLCLVRDVAGSAAAIAPPPAGAPVRVLLAAADPRVPTGRAGAGTLAHLETELRAVAAALEATGAACEVEVLRHCTPTLLRRRLEERPPHLFHFLGHGVRRPTGGALLLEGDREGEAVPLFGEELAGWLARAGVRLALLQACRSGHPYGVGEALAAGGVPAVVAMQLPWRDAAAPRFAGAFYGTLGAGVEAALREGRAAVRELGPDWAVPVLYLAAPHGRLFRFPPPGGMAALSPTNLPYLRSPRFVGRAALLGAVRDALAGEAPVLLTGMAGAGKTQLAVEYAHAYREEYPGGVFWLNARDDLRLRDDLAGLGRFFEVPEDLPTPQRAQRVRDLLARRAQPTLVVLDGAADDLGTVLPGGGACRLLLTSRDRLLARRGFRELPVPPLDQTAAVCLLEAHRAAEGVEERAAAHEIAAMVGCLPLALALAGHWLDRLGLTFQEYRDQLAGGCVDTLEAARRRFRTGTGHDGALFEAIGLACRGLEPTARVALEFAACLAGRGIDAELLLAAGAAPDRPRLREAVADLVDCSLATRERDGRLTLHALVSVFVLGEMPHNERRKAAAALAAVLDARLRAANEAMEWRNVRSEISHARAVLDLCRAEKLETACFPLLLSQAQYLFHHGDLRLALAYLREARPLAERCGGAAARARCLRLIADCAQNAGESEEAVEAARAALLTVESMPDLPQGLRADCLISLGYVHRMRGELDAALPLYRQALEALRLTHGSDHAAVATCVNNIGTLLEARGDLHGARQHLEEALAIDRRLLGEEHPRVAIRLNNLGRVLGRGGEWQEALRCHRRALAIYLATYGPENLDVAMSRFYAAEAELARGDAALARADCRSALEVLRRVAGPESRAAALVRARLCSLEEETGACQSEEHGTTRSTSGS